MFSKLSEKAVNALYAASAISDGEKELYVYGFYILFSYLFYLMVIVLLGVLFHIVADAVLFFCLFSLIRRYAGGVHASKETSCIIFTSLAFVLCIISIWLNTLFSQPTIAFIILAIGSASILLFAPLDTEEKRLSDAERIYFRRLSYFILVIIIMLAVVGFAIQKHRILYVCATSAGLEGLLLFIGFLKSNINNRHAHT